MKSVCLPRQAKSGEGYKAAKGTKLILKGRGSRISKSKKEYLFGLKLDHPPLVWLRVLLSLRSDLGLFKLTKDTDVVKGVGSVSLTLGGNQRALAKVSHKE